MRATLEDRLWAKVDRGRPGDCWPWNAHRNVRGYGVMRVDGKVRKAHRIAYTIAVGPIPEGLVVMHSCDNPPCCNPAHLSVGTLSDNTRDAVRKGRQVIPGGGADVNRAKTHCPQRHEYTPENTTIWNGRRKCKTCGRNKTRDYDRRRRLRANQNSRSEE